MADQIHPEYQYLNLLKDVMENGYEKKEFNTGIALKSVFGRQMRFDLSKGFPLLTTKKVFFRGIAHELIWFLSGSSNIKYLVDNKVRIWDDWAFKGYKEKIAKESVDIKNGYDVHEDGGLFTQAELIERIKDDDAFAEKWGELGPVYGKQWRNWPAADGREIDQLAWAIMKTRKYPDRKHVIVSAWNPEYIYEMAAPGTSMAIPPCHTFFNINVTNGKLSLQLYQRSADLFLGVPFNIASYAMLTMVLAQVCGYEVGEFVHTFGDAHIYSNHYDQVKEQLAREPNEFPKLIINPDKKEIDNFVYEDFSLEGYDPHGTIKGDITVVGGFNEKDRQDFQKKG